MNRLQINWKSLKECARVRTRTHSSFIVHTDIPLGVPFFISRAFITEWLGNSSSLQQYNNNNATEFHSVRFYQTWNICLSDFARREWEAGKSLTRFIHIPLDFFSQPLCTYRILLGDFHHHFAFSMSSQRMVFFTDMCASYLQNEFRLIFRK